MAGAGVNKDWRQNWLRRDISPTTTKDYLDEIFGIDDAISYTQSSEQSNSEKMTGGDTTRKWIAPVPSSGLFDTFDFLKPDSDDAHLAAPPGFEHLSDPAKRKFIAPLPGLEHLGNPDKKLNLYERLERDFPTKPYPSKFNPESIQLPTIMLTDADLESGPGPDLGPGQQAVQFHGPEYGQPHGQEYGEVQGQQYGEAHGQEYGQLHGQESGEGHAHQPVQSPEKKNDQVPQHVIQYRREFENARSFDEEDDLIYMPDYLLTADDLATLASRADTRKKREMFQKARLIINAPPGYPDSNPNRHRSRNSPQPETQVHESADLKEPAQQMRNPDTPVNPRKGKKKQNLAVQKAKLPHQVVSSDSQSTGYGMAMGSGQQMQMQMPADAFMHEQHPYQVYPTYQHGPQYMTHNTGYSGDHAAAYSVEPRMQASGNATRPSFNTMGASSRRRPTITTMPTGTGVLSANAKPFTLPSTSQSFLPSSNVSGAVQQGQWQSRLGNEASTTPTSPAPAVPFPFYGKGSQATTNQQAISTKTAGHPFDSSALRYDLNSGFNLNSLSVNKSMSSMHAVPAPINDSVRCLSNKCLQREPVYVKRGLYCQFCGTLCSLDAPAQTQVPKADEGNTQQE